jgi:hypothetical protein
VGVDAAGHDKLPRGVDDLGTRGGLGSGGKREDLSTKQQVLRGWGRGAQIGGPARPVPARPRRCSEAHRTVRPGATASMVWPWMRTSALAAPSWLTTVPPWGRPGRAGAGMGRRGRGSARARLCWVQMRGRAPRGALGMGAGRRARGAARNGARRGARAWRGAGERAQRPAGRAARGAAHAPSRARTAARARPHTLPARSRPRPGRAERRAAPSSPRARVFARRSRPGGEFGVVGAVKRGAGSPHPNGAGGVACASHPRPRRHPRATSPGAPPTCRAARPARVPALAARHTQPRRAPLQVRFTTPFFLDPVAAIKHPAGRPRPGRPAAHSPFTGRLRRPAQRYDFWKRARAPRPPNLRGWEGG